MGKLIGFVTMERARELDENVFFYILRHFQVMQKM